MKRIIISVLLIMVCCATIFISELISGYKEYQQENAANYLPITTPVTRSFSTIDLLWTESKYAEGWNMSIRSEASEIRRDTLYYSNESAGVGFFIQGKDGKEALGGQLVYNFLSPRSAEISYVKQFSTYLGETPVEWQYTSSVADQTSFVCYDNPDYEFPDCTWRARYEEYVMVFDIDWVPGVVELTDIEKMIFEVDQIMAEHLQLPLVE